MLKEINGDIYHNGLRVEIKPVLKDIYIGTKRGQLPYYDRIEAIKKLKERKILSLDNGDLVILNDIGYIIRNDKIYKAKWNDLLFIKDDDLPKL